MTEATSSSCGGIELLADDLVEPATVAKHTEAIRQAEQWMKVRSRSLGVINPLSLSTLRDLSCLVQDVAERSREKSNMLQGYGDTVLRAEALEEQLVKSRKHAAAMQSKLNAAFAKYHNDVMELQAKGDDLVRKNKGLRNKNKGTSFGLSGTCWKS
jgi:predicted  nucleic acid-binding Zn-ribbon protein